MLLFIVSTQLQYAEVPLVSNQICRDIYFKQNVYKGNISRVHLCAGGKGKCSPKTQAHFLIT